MAVLFPRGVEDYMACRCTRNQHARGISMHAVFFLLSEMVRPNAWKTLTKTAIIRSGPRGDGDTMHTSSAYSIPPIAPRTHSSAVS